MRFISLLAFLFLTSSIAFAKEVDFLGPIAESVHHIEMDQIDPSPDFHLIGGQLATSDSFPGIFQSRSVSSRCTATLVASRVVATAAHCVATGSLLTLNYKAQAYTGICARAVQFFTNPTADWALCLLDRPIPDQIAESIDSEGSGLYRGKEIQLMGFGCIQPGGTADGRLRFGKARITRLPQGTTYDIVTEGNVSLCPGDSGGPVFRVDQKTGLRYQIGVNSRSDLHGTSYMSALHSAAAKRFYQIWTDGRSVGICGLHDHAEGCRS